MEEEELGLVTGSDSAEAGGGDGMRWEREAMGAVARRVLRREREGKQLGLKSGAPFVLGYVRLYSVIVVLCCCCFCVRACSALVDQPRSEQ